MPSCVIRQEAHCRRLSIMVEPIKTTVILKLGRLDTGLRWDVRDYLRHRCPRILKITVIEDEGTDAPAYLIGLNCMGGELRLKDYITDWWRNLSLVGHDLQIEAAGEQDECRVLFLATSVQAHIR